MKNISFNYRKNDIYGFYSTKFNPEVENYNKKVEDSLKEIAMKENETYSINGNGKEFSLLGKNYNDELIMTDVYSEMVIDIIGISFFSESMLIDYAVLFKNSRT